jgi:hypothetical protein
MKWNNTARFRGQCPVARSQQDRRFGDPQGFIAREPAAIDRAAASAAGSSM